MPFFSALAHAPAAALVLGFGGLVPFVCLALNAATGLGLAATDARSLLADYGAVILSFVGALQWAYAVREEDTGSRAWLRFGWSVVPALLAWGALQLPVVGALRVLAGGLLAALVMDFLLRPARLVAWLMPLRSILSCMGSACLWLGSLGP
jgi:hypothetical protein